MVEKQNYLLLKRILTNKEEITKNIAYYIKSLNKKFSQKKLRNFELKVRDLIKNSKKLSIQTLIKKLKILLLFKNIKYTYTRRTIIFVKNNKKFTQIYDSKEYAWKVKKTISRKDSANKCL